MWSNVASTLSGLPVGRVPNQKFKILKQFFIDQARAGFDRFRSHPLGFFIYSETIGDGHAVRLHVWPDGLPSSAALSEEDIHDHVYELSSLVVFGAIRHDVFSIDECEGAEFELLEAVYDSKGSALKVLGTRVTLDTRHSTVHESGMIYRLSPRIIHRAQPMHLPTATIVATKTDGLVRGPLIVKKYGATASGKFDRELLTHEQRARFSRTLQAIDSDPTA